MAEKQSNNLKPMPTGRQARPPVVAVVGHVDHGKTTLLDFIRKTGVAGKEAGGITQSIGAYEVEHISINQQADQYQSASKITFIDTPGHEAFSRMRARGATIADLAILVVAADEGVKPQTKEAIEILKKTNTPFVVAITKIDKSNANIEKVKQELLANDVLLEGYGGDVSWQGISSISGEGINELLDLVLLTGEVVGLSFNPKASANGFILESLKDSRRGTVAHLILKNGILREGEEIMTKTASGKIRILENFLGKRVKELQPSAPALVVGFNQLPQTGEEFLAGRVEVGIIGVLGGPGLADILPKETEKVETEEAKERLRVILKADTLGSLEALKELLGSKVAIEASSVGDISDNDVKFAKSTESIIVGFKADVSKSVAQLAKSQEVKIITSDVIYKILGQVSALEKEEKPEEAGGTLEVLAKFSATPTKQTVGGRVVGGIMRVGAAVEIERSEEILGKGKILNLQHNKQDVKEVAQGNEAGLLLGETNIKIEVGDLLKIFR